VNKKNERGKTSGQIKETKRHTDGHIKETKVRTNGRRKVRQMDKFRKQKRQTSGHR